MYFLILFIYLTNLLVENTQIILISLLLYSLQLILLYFCWFICNCAMYMSFLATGYFILFLWYHFLKLMLLFLILIRLLLFFDCSLLLEIVSCFLIFTIRLCGIIFLYLYTISYYFFPSFFFLFYLLALVIFSYNFPSIPLSCFSHLQASLVRFGPLFIYFHLGFLFFQMSFSSLFYIFFFSCLLCCSLSFI